MTTSTTFPVPRRRLIASVASLACLLGGLFLIAGRDRAAAAPSVVRSGLGRHAGADFIGFYLTRDGRKVYCLSPRRKTPATVSLRPVTRYPGLSQHASDALSYALAVWGDARTRDAAAVESQVVNTLAGNQRDVARRDRALPASLRRLVRAHAAEARAMHGPYTLRVVTPAAPLPGAAATGRVQLVSRLGHPVVGARLALQVTRNGQVPATVRTDRHGSAAFRYSVLDVGDVRVTAAATGLPGTAALVSNPRSGQQRLAAAPARVTVRAASTFRGAVSGFAHRYSCTSDCAGRPTVRLHACAPASSLVSRVVYRVANRTVVSTFAPGGRRRCADATAAAPDRSTVSGAWQFRTSHGWSKPVAASGAFVVDCPAPPVITVTMVVDCAQSRVTGALPASAHRAVLVVSGAQRARVYAERGRAASWSMSVPCGAHDSLHFASGVQRLDGSWNYGRSASVITP